MEFRVSGPNFAGIMADIEGGVAMAATEAMRGTSYKTLLELRRQVTDNGLGQRLANTWRDRVYPEKRKSMTPTGYIWSNAPDIITSFASGATVRPHGNAKYLWIPTNNVPRARGRSRATSTGRMTPDQVEAEYGQRLLVLKGRRGRLLAFLARDRVATKRGGFRKSRLGYQARGKQELKLMFTLVRTVRLPKLLDLQGPARLWEQRFADEFSRRMAG